MLKGKLTKYGSLILNKDIRRSLLLHEGDKFILARDASKKEEGSCVYFIRTKDHAGALNIEKRHGLFYIRLSRYLSTISLKLPCHCNIYSFQDDGMEGFKVEFINGRI